jgi:hypothetical protein
MKNALLVGITYDLSEQKSININKSLQSTHRFLETRKYDSIHTLSNKATYQDIINGFDILVKNAGYDDEIWFHFIGYSSTNRKSICPYDYRSKGSISENELFNQFINRIPLGVRCYIIIDTFSNSGISLRHCVQDQSRAIIAHPNKKYNYNEWELRQLYIENCNYKRLRADVYLISLTLDKNVIFIYPLLTNLLLEIITSNITIKWKHLIKDISCNLKLLKYKHNVQVFSGNTLQMDSHIFNDTIYNNLDLRHIDKKMYILV